MSFSDPDAVARYAEGPGRQVPGFHGLQQMAHVLLAESVPEDGHALVLGAGGGRELKAVADAHRSGRFTGVDPSAEMLKLAVATLGIDAVRADLVEGYIDDAPPGPFDGGTCLLTLHFLAREQRLHTLHEVRRRLAPGAPFVVAHHSVDDAAEPRERWLSRYAAFAVACGIPAANMANAAAAIAERLPLLSPTQDEALQREAGFVDIEIPCAAFTFRGWVMRNPR